MNKKLLNFIIYNFIFFIIFIFLTFKLKNYILKYKNKDQISFKYYLNRGELPSKKNLLIGLLFGLTFGFIDNFTMWVGIDSIQSFLPGGLLLKSAIGNIYSNIIGVLMGITISLFAEEMFDYKKLENEPIWLDILGIIIGCIFGIGFGYLVTGDT